MREKLEVDQIWNISDGNGGELEAKITEVAPYEIAVRTRKVKKGARWSAPSYMKRRAFWKAVDAAA